MADTYLLSYNRLSRHDNYHVAINRKTFEGLARSTAALREWPTPVPSRRSGHRNAFRDNRVDTFGPAPERRIEFDSAKGEPRLDFGRSVALLRNLSLRRRCVRRGRHSGVRESQPQKAAR